MNVAFTTLPPTARVWVYQATRAFTQQESSFIQARLAQVLEQWTAHGNTLKAGFDLPYQHFIVIGLDESLSGASGCSIDALFRHLKALGEELNIDFFNRELVGFLVNNEVQLIPRADLITFFQQADAEVLTLNNLVSDKHGLMQAWLQPAKTSWLKRYMPAVSV